AAEPDDPLMVEVQADGDVTVRLPGERTVLAARGVNGKRPVDATGRVEFDVTHERETVRIIGTVKPDGTGTGAVRVDDEMAPWTARRVGDGNAQDAATREEARTRLQMELDADLHAAEEQAKAAAILHQAHEHAEATSAPRPAPGETMEQAKTRIEKELATLQDELLTQPAEGREIPRIQRRIQELERQLSQLQAGVAPTWAVGGWKLSVPEEKGERLIVLTHQGEVAPLTPDFIVTGEVRDRVIDPTGAVELEVEFTGDAGAFAGRINPDGTARGAVKLENGETAAWTATRIGGGWDTAGAAAGEPARGGMAMEEAEDTVDVGATIGVAVPPWAVGEWQVTPRIEDYPVPERLSVGVEPDGGVTVRPLGEGFPEVTVVELAGKRPVQPSGNVAFGMQLVPELGEEATIVIDGKLKPGGTGAGTFRADDGEMGTWTATRVQREGGAGEALDLNLQVEELLKTRPDAFGIAGEAGALDVGGTTQPANQDAAFAYSDLLWQLTPQQQRSVLSYRLTAPNDLMADRALAEFENAIAQTAPTGVAVLIELAAAPEEALAGFPAGAPPPPVPAPGAP
ncbi:MAG: hypothetical protein ACE5JM_15270, partial [Armatimonadota bacterium]